MGVLQTRKVSTVEIPNAMTPIYFTSTTNIKLLLSITIMLCMAYSKRSYSIKSDQTLRLHRQQLLNTLRLTQKGHYELTTSSLTFSKKNAVTFRKTVPTPVTHHLRAIELIFRAIGSRRKCVTT